MLMSNEFVREEHKYRGEVLRDQYHRETKGRVGKAVTALVVAGAIALAACGAPADGNTPIKSVEKPQATDLEYAFSGNEAPVPQGSRGLLSQILGTDAADPEMAFSGVEAPVAQGTGLNLQGTEPASGPR